MLRSFILKCIVREEINVTCFRLSSVFGVTDLPLVDNAFLWLKLNLVIFYDGINAILGVAEQIKELVVENIRINWINGLFFLNMLMGFLAWIWIKLSLRIFFELTLRRDEWILLNVSTLRFRLQCRRLGYWFHDFWCWIKFDVVTSLVFLLSCVQLLIECYSLLLVAFQECPHSFAPGVENFGTNRAVYQLNNLSVIWLYLHWINLLWMLFRRVRMSNSSIRSLSL